MRITPFALGLSIAVSACTASESAESEPLVDLPNGAQAVSLLGDTLYPSEPDSADIEKLVVAEAAYQAHPDNADSLIWYGRWTAYTGNYRGAIRIFSEGIEKHPEDARMYRHRGHRYITIRMYDEAIADFSRAAELIAGQDDQIEPDGRPNPAGIPVSTLHSNIYYHLGLAKYLKQDFAGAIVDYKTCIALETNPDNLVSTTHWLYMALRRMNRDQEADDVLDPITNDLEIIENHAYYQLLRMYKGEITPESLMGDDGDSPESSAVGYGLANYHYYNDRTELADNIYHHIVENTQWEGFGNIAAEADLVAIHHH